MKRSVQILRPDSLRAVYGRAAEGQMALTLEVDLAWSDHSQGRAFVKCFHRDRELGLVNEVSGYVIARGCGLPVPRKAALIQLPSELTEKLPAFSPWAFAISEAPGATPTTLCDLNDPVVRAPVLEVLAQWSRLCEALAFDDWTANQDRNAGNLLIDGPDRIYLIDHSNLPVALVWTPEDLLPDGQFCSKLSQIVSFVEEATLPQRTAVAVATKKHPDVYAEVKEELMYWWDLMLQNDPRRRAALERFVDHRAVTGYERVTKNQHLLAV